MAARQVRTPWASYKRQSIQEAVIRLICREGLKSVTMERVAEETGIAKGTVYLHYRDKQELLDSVKESALTPVMRNVETILRGEGAAAGKLRDCATEYLSYFDQHRDLFRVLIYERAVTRAQGSRYQSERYQHLLQDVAKVIRDGFRSVDAHNVAAMFIESMFAVMNQRLRSEKPAPVERDVDLIVDVFMHGLQKRRKA